MHRTEKGGRIPYLGMEESDVFVDGLTEPIRFWKSIIAGYKVEYGLRSKISEF